jgi:hypothetical protein
MPQSNPKSGEIYRHFKNKMYQIIGIVTHSETREKMVWRQALYGDYGMYGRPYDMFISEVDHAKYPEVTQKYRFEFVGNAGEGVTAASPVATERAAAPVTSERTAAPVHSTVSEEKFDVPTILNKFLDTDDLEEKYQLVKMISEDDITEFLVDSMAVSLDIIIPEGKLIDRFDELKSALKTKAKYEADGIGNRLRR